MNLVDSSGWLEYFADGPNAECFAPPIEDTANLIVPSIILYEVFKKVLQHKDEATALQSVAFVYQGKVVDLDAEIALDAARISVGDSLPMADSIILATGSRHEAVIWTQDSDFQNIEGVRYFAHKGN